MEIQGELRLGMIALLERERERVEVAPFIENIVESLLRRFGHV